MTIRIFIGTEPSQDVPRRVLTWSIQSMSADVEITPITQVHERIGGTNFGFARFLVPNLSSYQGTAVYCDADQVLLSPIEQLVSLTDHSKDVWLVQEPEGDFNGKEPVGNQTSVMVLNCGALKDWNPETLFKNVVPNRSPLGEGQIHYRDFMTLKWLDPARIGAIPPRWNHFNILRDDTALVHFSHVRSQPWKNRRHELSDWWIEQLNSARKAKYVSANQIIRACLRKDLHPDCLRVILKRK